MKSRVIAILVGSLLFAGDASAWSLRGHMMVAAAAWDQLTPQAKARSNGLLKLNPNYRKWIAGIPAAPRSKTAFTRAAGWADDIKSDARCTNDGNDSSGP